METPKQRLERIYSRYNTNASDIERRHKELYPKSKFTKQTLYNIESELTKSISGKNALIIKEIFPEIDFLWLTSGEGHLLTESHAFADAPDKKADALQQLGKVQNGKPKNAGEGRRVNEGDVIKIKTFVIPIKGFSGLKNALYDDQYIMENFEQETTEVPKEYYASTSYKIQSTGNSMPKTIPEGAWVTGVPIPEQDWMNYKFRSDKIYIFFHPYKGILFKNAKNIPHDEVRLCSENIDKEDYPDEDFKITEFRKICVAIKVETFI